MACRVSNPSFFVFHASLLLSDKIVVPFISESRSTRGKRSSIGSATVPFVDPTAGATFLTSSCSLVGCGASIPSTLSNSEKMVVRSWGFKSSRRSLMAAGYQTMPQVIGNDTLTRTRKELDSDQGLRCASSNRSVRVLQTGLQEFDKTPHG